MDSKGNGDGDGKLSLARPVLGRVGIVAVLVAAVFSTASAINATLFASARLGSRVADDGQLPPTLTRLTRGGVPVPFLALLAIGAGVVASTGSLERITTFSSLVFLSVFGVVNAAALAHGTWTGWGRLLPAIGFVGCLGAAGTLATHLWRTDRPSLWVVLAISAGLLILRLLYVLFHSHFRERHG